MSNNSSTRPIDILLFEDNPAYIRLTKEALKEGKVLNNFYSITDGVEAVKFLKREKQYKDAVVPDLILFDLNLPKKNGSEVLREIKEDNNFKNIPVAILTTSKEEQDVIKSYNLYANRYITKPVDLENFINVVKSIEDFWLTIVKLPTSNGGKLK